MCALLGAGAGTLLLPGSATRAGAQEGGAAASSGEGIMRASVARNSRFPYIFEQYTLILTDQFGHREVRRARRYSRAEEDGTLKLLLVFDDPQAIRGVALLAMLHAERAARTSVYLPAFGPHLKHPGNDAPGGNVLGTDFSVADLAPEALSANRYAITGERRIDDTWYDVVDAYPVDERAERASGYGLRRHLVGKDNLVIARTDFYDRRLRYIKRLSRHDLRRIRGDSWLADMVLVESEISRHSTLLKVDRRIYSRDYVPAHMFEPEWLLANRHMLDDSLAPGAQSETVPSVDKAQSSGDV